MPNPRTLSTIILRRPLERGRNQFRREEPDAPQPDHPGDAQEQSDDRIAAPSRIAKELGRRADVLVSDTGGRVRLGLQPRFAAP